MKTDKKILIAFLLNLFFSIFEFVGGAITGSVAVISDAIHDFGDAFSIGLSYFLEKLSLKRPNSKYTFGYYRYSVLGSVIQSSVLLFGSVLVIYNSILRFINPKPINYNGMIIMAIVGFLVNFIAAYFTSGEGSLNQKSINLHMLEDVLGWAIVLIGSIVMKFTDWAFLDNILSIAVAVFIVINAIKGLKAVFDIFLEKTPDNIDFDEIKEHILKIDGIIDVHHLHIWSMDGFKTSATMHIIAKGDFTKIKHNLKEELEEHGISHSTIEFETVGEECDDKDCTHTFEKHSHHHHHHHH